MKKVLIKEQVKTFHDYENNSDMPFYECTCGKNFIEFKNYEKHWKTHFKPMNKQKKKEIEKINKQALQDILRSLIYRINADEMSKELLILLVNKL